MPPAASVGARERESLMADAPTDVQRRLLAAEELLEELRELIYGAA